MCVRTDFWTCEVRAWDAKNGRNPCLVGIIENEGTLLGGIGVFAKEASIVCGGKNGLSNLKTCWEFDYNSNK